MLGLRFHRCLLAQEREQVFHGSTAVSPLGKPCREEISPSGQIGQAVAEALLSQCDRIVENHTAASECPRERTVLRGRRVEPESKSGLGHAVTVD
jgi:hypothetical protein